jgi:hypothetical protein
MLTLQKTESGHTDSHGLDRLAGAGTASGLGGRAAGARPGASVQRLSQVIPPVGRVRSGSSLIEMSWQRVVINTFETESALERVTDNVPSSCGVHSGIPSERRTERRDVHDANSNADSHDGIGGPGDHQPLVAKVPLTALEILAGDFSGTDWIDGFPDLAGLPIPNTRLESQLSVYADAYRDWRAGVVKLESGCREAGERVEKRQRLSPGVSAGNSGQAVRSNSADSAVECPYSPSSRNRLA